MELNILASVSGDNSGSLKVDDAVFARDYHETMIHQVVNAYLANARLGTRAQKNRSAVNKSTKKPFRQKGTGNARAGMASSPLWRGGGKIFPSSPDENFSQKVNRKVYRSAITSIVSELVRANRLMVVDQIALETPKTKDFVKFLANLKITKEVVLVVVDELTEQMYLASRNLHHVVVLQQDQLDPYILVRCDKTIFTVKAIEMFQGRMTHGKA